MIRLVNLGRENYFISILLSEPKFIPFFFELEKSSPIHDSHSYQRGSWLAKCSRESANSNSSPSNHSHIHSLQHILSKRGLVIACININSLVAHIDQLRIFLSLHKIDILAINETKQDSTITSSQKRSYY